MKTTDQARCAPPPVFPRPIFNRPALPRIDYRIGDYPEIRASLLYHLDRAPELARWTHREADDPGIALLECAAIIGDVVTFYQQLYANEAFLRTASWRESIVELVRLTGYRPAPGLGGQATFALEVRGDRAISVPAGLPLQVQLEGSTTPSTFETDEDIIAYPWLSRFRLYRPMTARYLASGHRELVVESTGGVAEIEPDDRLLVGVPVGGSSDPDRLDQAQVVVVEEVVPLHGKQVVTIRGALRLTGTYAQLAAYKLGRSFRHFGHNAPPSEVHIDNGRSSQQDIRYGRWLTKETSAAYIDPPLQSSQFPLDNEVDNLSLGSRMLVQSFGLRVEVAQGGKPGKGGTGKGTASACPLGFFLPGASGSGMAVSAFEGWEFQDTTALVRLRSSSSLPEGTVDSGQAPASFTHVRTVDGLDPIGMRWGALSGASTRVTLDAGIATGNSNSADIREIQLHEVIGLPLTVRAKSAETSASGNVLYFAGSPAQAEPLLHRRLLWDEGEAGPRVVTVTAVGAPAAGVPEQAGLIPITLDGVVAYASFANEGPTRDVFGNLADASQGKTEREAILGNGDAGQSFQTFKLPKAPLTYHYAPGGTPPQAPELTIYVGDQEWTRVATLFGRGPDERIYVVREDDEENSYVQFGDGRTGARLPSGLRNVRALYRSGNGAFGAAREGTTVQAQKRVENLNRVTLPGVASGGEPRESGEKARATAPRKLQALGRIVSLSDVEAEALALPGVAAAAARWAVEDGAAVIVVTLLMKNGREAEFDAVEQSLRHAAFCRGPDRFPIMVHEGRFEYVFIDVQYALHPGVLPESVPPRVQAALGVVGQGQEEDETALGLFSLPRRGFGQDESADRIVGAVQNVPGVAWARLLAFDALGAADDPGALAPPASPMLRGRIQPSPDAVLRLFDGPGQGLLKLRTAPAAAPGVCDD
jgi:hypothetical protein